MVPDINVYPSLKGIGSEGLNLRWRKQIDGRTRKGHSDFDLTYDLNLLDPIIFFRIIFLRNSFEETILEEV